MDNNSFTGFPWKKILLVVIYNSFSNCKYPVNSVIVCYALKIIFLVLQGWELLKLKKKTPSNTFWISALTLMIKYIFLIRKWLFLWYVYNTVVSSYSKITACWFQYKLYKLSHWGAAMLTNDVWDVTETFAEPAWTLQHQ